MDSFFEYLALCVHFILKGDITFARVEGELWGQHRDIEALGSVILGRRHAGLIYDVEVALKVLADRRANLAHDVQALFEQRWVGQEGGFIPKRELRARAFMEMDRECVELEKYIRGLADPS